MYRGVEVDRKIDSQVEFERFIRPLEIIDNTGELYGILEGFFFGVMRNTLGYLWLIEEKNEVSLSGKCITIDIFQDEKGKLHNDVLGNWSMTIKLGNGTTTESTLKSILLTMERYVRARFSLSEPEGLDSIMHEYRRKQLIEKCFCDYVK